jgi:hypothetical protein
MTNEWRNKNSEKNCENPGHEKTDVFLERVEPTLELAISDIMTESQWEEYQDLKKAARG